VIRRWGWNWQEFEFGAGAETIEQLIRKLVDYANNTRSDLLEIEQAVREGQIEESYSQPLECGDRVAVGSGDAASVSLGSD
jgi:hypothetical protein